jgi:hypothetical protein
MRPIDIKEYFGCDLWVRDTRGMEHSETEFWELQRLGHFPRKCN